MWNTPNGLRVLDGAEAELFKTGLALLVDEVRAEKDMDSEVSDGIGIFEQLIWCQKMSLLRDVSRALLLKEVDPPSKAALLEGAVAAIYAQIQSWIEYEIDRQRSTTVSEPGDTSFRQMLVAALEQNASDQNWPDTECVVMGEWEIAIFEIRSWVLADSDWEMEHTFLDVGPDDGGAMKQFLGIDADYFVLVPPDPDTLNPGRDWADIVELTGSPRPDEDILFR